MYPALIFGYGQLADGSLDAQTRYRCRKAVELYQAGKIKVVFLTVAASKTGVLMAEAMRDFLVSQGVDREAIGLIPQGCNTAGEMDVFLQGLTKDTPVVFISTWYHIPRIVWLALWRLPWRRIRIGVSWRHAHFRADVLVEFAKLAKAFLWPRRSAKVVGTEGKFNRDLFLMLMAEGSISAQQFADLDRRGLID